MALVAVQQPGQRETQLDAIAKALNIAQSIYGIKTAYEQTQLAKAREERMSDAEIAQEERQKKLFGLQEKEYQRKEAESKLEADVLKTGALLPKDFAQNFYEINENQIKDIGQKFNGLVPVVKAKVYRHGTKEGENNYEERWAVPKSAYDAATSAILKAKGDRKEGIDWKAQLRLDKSLDELYKKQETAGIGVIFQKLSQIENTLPGGLEGSEDIPGQGATRDFPQFMLSEQGKRVRQQLEDLTDLILRQRTGAAYGAHEAQKIQNILGNIRLGSDADLRRALQDLKANMYDYNKRIEASLPDKNAIAEAAASGGFTSMHPFWSTGLGSLRQTNQGSATPTVRYNKGGSAPVRPVGQQTTVKQKFTPESNRANALDILRD